MGLFSFFKKKPANKPSEANTLNPNQYLLEELRKKLTAEKYKVETATAYLALVINGELEIAIAIVDVPDTHPSIMYVLFATIDKTHFPDGIIEHVVGIGNSFEEKVSAVVDSYITNILPPIIDSFSDGHTPELDYSDVNGILWHPKLGDLVFQGQWDNPVDDDPILNLLKEDLKSLALTNKFNWLKVYAAKQANNSITAECLLNNEHWQQGYEKIYNYAQHWQQTTTFLGQRQFIMLRRCDAFDELIDSKEA